MNNKDWDYMIEKLVLAGFALLVCVVGYIGVVLLPKQLDREQAAKEKAEGCVFLGHPRDLNTVFFYDCDGTIIMKRVK